MTTSKLVVPRIKASICRLDAARASLHVPAIEQRFKTAAKKPMSFADHRASLQDTRHN